MEKSWKQKTYTSYDLALDNRDALKSDVYKNAENYYKSVFENKPVEASTFYPDKNGSGSDRRDCTTERLRRFPYRSVKDFCKKHGITENVFLYFGVWPHSW